MIRLGRITGFLIGTAVAIHGCALAVTGNRLLAPTTRGGSQHYWNAPVGAFGERGAAWFPGDSGLPSI